MGIQNFFQEFGQAKQPKNLSDYKGQKCAIDGYVWMHQALYARQVNTEAYKKVDRFVAFFQAKIDQLLRHNIKIIIVWDGAKHPMKQKTNNERFIRRKENYEKAIQKFKTGYTSECIEDFKKAIAITPGLVHVVQKKLEHIYKDDVQFLTAPYEADAQLVYLNQTGIVDFIISIDSDLMVFGAKKVLYKMDYYFNGEEYTQERVLEILSQNIGKQAQLVDLIKVCVLRGCDYLNSPYGIGLKTAMKLYKDYDCIESLVAKSNYNFEQNYLLEYYKSYLTFRYMWIYCPMQQKYVYLNKDITKDDNYVIQRINQLCSFDFMGQRAKDDIAIQIAQGKIDPITGTSFIEEFNLLHKISKYKTKNVDEFDISFSIILNELEKQFLQDYNQKKSRDDSSLLDDRKKINYELLMNILKNRQIQNLSISKLPIDPIDNVNSRNQTNYSQDLIQAINAFEQDNVSQLLDNSTYNFQQYDLLDDFRKMNLKDKNMQRDRFRNINNEVQVSKDDMSFCTQNDFKLKFLLSEDFQNNQQQKPNNQNYEYFSFQNNQFMNKTSDTKNDQFYQDLKKCAESTLPLQKDKNLFQICAKKFQKLKSNNNNNTINTQSSQIHQKNTDFQVQTQNGNLQSKLFEKDLPISNKQLQKDPSY